MIFTHTVDRSQLDADAADPGSSSIGVAAGTLTTGEMYRFVVTAQPSSGMGGVATFVTTRRSGCDRTA